MALWQDIRFAVRLLLKDKWFTAAAATALALGIGANAAVFTFVNAVLIRGLPFDEPDRILSIITTDTRNRRMSVALSDFQDFREQSKTVSGLAAYLGTVVNVSDDTNAADQFRGSYVSGNLFQLIGAKPIIGRDFSPENDQLAAEPVVVLGNGIWKNRYGSDPSIVGKIVRVNSLPATVIGVMPPSMQFPNNDDLWVPLSKLPDESRDPRRSVRNFGVIARLAPDATLPQAQAEFAAIGKRLAEAYPATNKDVRPDLLTFNDRQNEGPIATVFLLLMGAVAFVLLIACANVANLLLARSAFRTREISIRVSLGATRWRIVRQLLIESVLLSLIAGAFGFVLAVAGIRWFDRATQNVGKPYYMTFDLDVIVIAFMAAVCLGTAVLFGLAPALHVSKTDANEMLKEGGRGGTSGKRARRWTGTLIVTEIALTLVLLAGAGLIMRSFYALYRLDTGVDASRLLTMRLYLPLTRYPTPAPRVVVFERFEERLAGMPNLQASTLTTNAPLSGGFLRNLNLEGHSVPAGERLPTVTMLPVGDTYFETLGMKLLRGRSLAPGDGLPGHEVAVVNQRFASLYFKNDDPMGRRIKLTMETPTGVEPQWTTIVGIAPNVRQRDLQLPEPDPIVYIPNRADPQRTMMLLVRTADDPAAVTASVREAMRAVEPDLPLFDIQTMDQLMARQRWQFTVFGSMFAAFAGTALLLSAVGLYAVTSYAVTQRTQEIGIRMALGAKPKGMLWLVLQRALIQLGIGLPLGLAGAYGVGRILQTVLIGTSPTDPVALGGTVALLVSVAVAACLWPARRAARLDPMIALRYE